MNILSIQSHVAYGHVGNSAVVLPLQRRGHTVWPVHTVMLSNHAGYADCGGQTVPAPVLADIVAALDRRGALARCDAVLSGFLGDAATGDVVLDAVGRVRRGRRDSIYCCDPVMGDDGAVYVDAAIPPFMRVRAAPAADILTPNLFELALLTDVPAASLAGAPLTHIIAAARKLFGPDRRTAAVLVTSLSHAGMGPGTAAMVAVDDGGAWLVTTPEVPFEAPPHGAGDLCAALFCAALREGGDAASALVQTASTIHALLDETARRGDGELSLVAAQDMFGAPLRTFGVERVG